MAVESKEEAQQDLLFAQLAIEKGFLESEKLESAVALQKELLSRGEPRRLSSLLIQTGDMSPGQVREILTDLEKNIITCGGCAATFNIAGMAPGRKFLCKRCKTVVVVPGDEDPVQTPAPRELAQTVAVSHEEAGGGPPEADEGPDQMLEKVVGGCRIEVKLGAGGMGTVYKAIQISLNRPVALKILSRTLSTNEEYIARFEREARAVAVLNHPNIVQVYDMGKDDEGFYFIVMEYVDGTTLSDLWKEKGVLDEAFALKAIRQACGGLHAAHEAGILHRDIKPENLMISKGGRIKIADFGLAKETHGDSQLTGTGIALGTPAYMAPEQGMGESPDRRSDIYSLGGTLFTLLTARLPYEAKSPLAMMMKHATDPVPLARKVNPAVSEASEALIVKSMAKEPQERFKDLNEMRLAVQAGLDALEKAPKPSVPAPPPPKKTPSPIKTRSPMMTPSPMKRPKKKKPPSAEYRSTPTPAKKSTTPRGTRKTAKGGDPTPRGAKAVTPHRSGKKTSSATKSGAHKTGRHPAQSKGSPALLIGAGAGFVAVLLLIVILAVVMGGNGKDTDADGGSDKGGETSGSSDSGKTGTGKGGGETGSGTGDGTSGTGETTPSDEPEGPFEPPRLPEGVRRGDNPGEYINEKDETVLVYVPAGRAELGLSREDLEWIQSWFPDYSLSDYTGSMPKRSIYLDGFFIGKYEVTNEQYELFIDWFMANPGERDKVIHPESPMGNNPKPTWWGIPAFSKPDAAVVGMDWYDAYAYAKWAGMELPTEAQWLKAATWDPKTRKGRFFPWGDSVDERAALVADRVAGKLFKSNRDFGRWNRGKSSKEKEALRPAPVEDQGQDVSPVGAVGMCGNVEEWCRDYWHGYYTYDSDASDRNACDHAYYPGRVVRGGHFSTPLIKYFHRGGYYSRAEQSDQFTGFRCAIPLVSFPEEILSDIGEAELRALPDEVKKRTVVGLLESMKEKKEWAGVIMRAKWALDQWEEEAEFYKRLAVALAETDKMNDAVFELEKGVNLGKTPVQKADLYYWMGRILWLGNDFEKAFGAFKKSSEANGRQYLANYWCAKYLLEKKKANKEALEYYEKALRYTWSGANGFHSAGIAKDRLGDLEGALEYFTAAILESNNRPSHVYDRGFLLLKLKRWDQAEKDFNKCIELRDSSSGYLGLAQMYEAKGDKKKALEMAEKGLKFPKTDEWAYRNLGALRDRLKKG